MGLIYQALLYQNLKFGTFKKNCYRNTQYTVDNKISIRIFSVFHETVIVKKGKGSLMQIKPLGCDVLHLLGLHIWR